MIRTNLSTRPFYNETAVRFWLLVLGVVVAAATVFNVQRLVSYSRSDTDLATRATRDEQRAKELLAEAVRLRGSVDTKQIEATSVEARVANDLIDRRTFSWTELFNRFETTLPSEVRITSLRKSQDRTRGDILSIALVARNVDDVNEFMEKLAATSEFSDLLVTDDRMNPDLNQLEAVLQAVYHPPTAPPVPAAVRPVRPVGTEAPDKAAAVEKKP